MKTAVMNKYGLLLLTIGFIFIAYPVLIAQSNEQSSTPFETNIVDEIYSNTLKENREFWVKIPEGYHPDSELKYPVVYLLDGFSLRNPLEVVYENYWGHYMPHMILVGVSNKTNRRRDLTTSKIALRDGTAMDEATGGAEKFTRFIEKELIPHIDSKYPTTAYRTLIGHSYGGLFTINMLLNHKELFENYIAIDPSLQWDNQKMLKQAKKKMTAESYAGKSLYVSLAAEQLHIWDEQVTMGNVMEDETEFTLFARSIIEFSNFATAQQGRGFNFSWKVYEEDLHGTVPLPTIRDGLVFLFDWYQFKSPQRYNNPDTPVKELLDLLEKQEAIYAKHFGYTVPPMVEEMFNGYGYMNLQMGQPEKALLFFEKSIAYYPQSANAYDSMADYYEAQNDKANALKFVTKAYELSGKQQYKERMKGLEEK